MSLSDLGVGETGVVRRVRSGPAGMGSRLAALGFLPGTPVAVVRQAPLGDPVVLELRGYQLCLRRRDASAVEVERDGTGRH